MDLGEFISMGDLRSSKQCANSGCLHSYAFLVHGIGPAVGGQGFSIDPDPDRCSSQIIIKNNHVHNMKVEYSQSSMFSMIITIFLTHSAEQCWTKEIPGMYYWRRIQHRHE